MHYIKCCTLRGSCHAVLLLLSLHRHGHGALLGRMAVCMRMRKRMVLHGRWWRYRMPMRIALHGQLLCMLRYTLLHVGWIAW